MQLVLYMLWSCGVRGRTGELSADRIRRTKYGRAYMLQCCVCLSSVVNMLEHYGSHLHRHIDTNNILGEGEANHGFRAKHVETQLLVTSHDLLKHTVHST